MSRIYWDSMLFIYWLEDNPDYAPRVDVIRSAMQSRGDTLCTSVFTTGEVLTGLYGTGDIEIISQIRDSFGAEEIELIPFNADTADQYARIRSACKVAPADAIHLASAAQAGVNLFLTNDRRLHKLKIPSIDFIAGLDVNLF